MHTQYLLPSAILFTLIFAAAFCCGQDLIDRGAPGVLVCIYDIQEPMRQLPDLAPGQLPNAVKVARTLDLDGARGDFDPFKDCFITEVSGFLNITQAGKYTFRLLSDDGARLWINGRLVIDHDGLHGPVPKDGVIELVPRQHPFQVPFRVLHFEAGGGERLALLWKPPGVKEEADFVLIPPSVLTHDAQAPRETSPGKKRIIPPLRRGRPGDGTAVAGVHPSFQLFWAGTGPRWERGLAGLPYESLRVLANSDEFASPPCVWLPPVDVPADVVSLLSLRKGTFDGQILVACYPRDGVQRMFVDEEGRLYQGCVFRFTQGLAESVKGLTTASDHRGDWVHVYMPDAQPTDPVARVHKQQCLKPTGNSTFEMLAVRVMLNGFEIEFTKPLDERVGWEVDSYYVEQWPFDMDEQMPPARDGVRYPVKSASVSPDRRKVFLELDDLKTSHVVYIRLLPPCVSEDGELPWSTEAWYTLNAIPKDRHGKVLAPPTKEPQNMLTEEQRRAGWKLLFDGKTTAGWRGFKKDAFPHKGWTVSDGCLVRVGPGGDICTEEEFDDFELELEWRISAGGNSGIFFRASEQFKWPWETAPEMQVLDNAEHADGRNPKTSAGSNYALHAPIRDVTEPVGLFNRARILADGNHIEYWLNGVKVVEYEIASPEWEKLVADSKFKAMPNYGRTKKGRIVLQDHGDRVWYRNIKIRPLGAGK